MGSEHTGIINKCDKARFAAEDKLKSLRELYNNVSAEADVKQREFEKSEKERKKKERQNKRKELLPSMEYVNASLALCGCEDIFIESVKENIEIVYGIPSLKKYPLDTKKHVYSAIKLFGHVDSEHEEELGKNILSAMEHYNISTDNIGSKNRLAKYI